MAVTIRKMLACDADALCQLLSNPEVMRYLEAPYDRLQAEDFLHRAGLADPPLIYAAEEDGTFIGYVIYHPYDEKSMEIGWVLFPEYWGRGYASALTDLLARKAAQAHMDTVIECVPEQTATRRIALKKGFLYGGICNGLAVYRLAH